MQFVDAAFSELQNEIKEITGVKLGRINCLLGGQIVPVVGVFEVQEEQETIEYKTTYSGTLQLRGSIKPRLIELSLLYMRNDQFLNNPIKSTEFNHAEQLAEVMKYKLLKRKNVPIPLAVAEYGLAFLVMIEGMRVTYGSARSVIIDLQLREVRNPTAQLAVTEIGIPVPTDFLP